MAGCRVYLKPESLQKNGSYKIRGAHAALSSIPEEARDKGIITSSSGNWAQGMAYSCQRLGVKVLIVVPEFVTKPKLEATKNYGAETLVYGSSSLDVVQKVRELSEEKGLTWIHAFQEPMFPTFGPTLLGYGTIALEILEDQPDIDTIIAPVGSGALISGIALAARQIKPGIRIIGVQPEGAAAMYASLKAGKVEELKEVKTMAEGLALKRVGEMTFQLVRDNVDKLVLVTEDEIKSAMILLLERAKLLVEPSGSVPLAALLNGKVPGLKRDSNVVVVLTGGNVDLSVLKTLLPED
jgi:threonine dehydratase